MGEGAFRIVEVLASGSHGVVCAAHIVNSPDQPLVALKVLRDVHAGGDMEDRIRDEARMLSRLSHWNIVGVEDLVYIQGRPVLVMEWVRGVSCKLLLHHHPNGLPIDVGLEIIRETALALNVAWSAPVDDGKPLRIIHRDINPNNLMVDIEGTTKVIDFGIAKGDFEDREAVTTMLVRGAWGYAAPERLDAIPDTPAVDVYGMGVTMFELLSGRSLVLPRQEDSYEAALRDQISQLQPSAEMPEAQRAALSQLLVQMLAQMPDDRPSTETVAAELARIMADAFLLPDMSGFARTYVIPLLENSHQGPVESHPLYEELRILETEPPDTAPRPPRKRMRRPSPDIPIHRFLKQTHWEQDLPQLRLILASNPGWTVRPFVAVLDAAAAPRWQFWRRSISVEQVAAALSMLRFRATKDVQTRARALSHHRDHAIAQAATVWLKKVSR